MNKQLMIFQMRAFLRLFKSLTASLNILKAQRFKFIPCVLRVLPTVASCPHTTLGGFQIHLKMHFAFHGLFWPKFLTFLKPQIGYFLYELRVKGPLHLNVYLDIYLSHNYYLF